jgi:pilus assembly protein CpaF
MAMMSDVDLPAAHIRNQVAAAVDVIVHLARLRGGRRVVWEIAAIEGTHRGEPVVTSLFRFRPRAGENGSFEASGDAPQLAAALAERGEHVPAELFATGTDS